VEPLPVLSINYSGESHGPWPRILKILAVVAIVFGALRVGAGAAGLRSFWGVRASFPSMTNFYWILWGLDVGLNLWLAVGGLRLLIRPGRHRLLLLAAWFWCILTALGLIYQVLVSVISSGAVGYLPFTIFYAALQTVFPVTLILLLSEYQKSQQIAPQPVVPPAFKRWPGPPSDPELRVTKN
jgi:hypothetical protein